MGEEADLIDDAKREDILKRGDEDSQEMKKQVTDPM
jgi:hypothetical protein